MSVRPYQPSDRDRVLGIIGDARAVDSSSHHVVVADGSDALALLIANAGGEDGELALVHAPAQPRLFYELALGACDDAIAAGLTRGSFTIHDEKLLRRLRRDFRIEPVPSGWEPGSGRPTQWDVHVSLQDARQQLARTLDRRFGNA